MRFARTSAGAAPADRFADLPVHVRDVAAVHVDDLGVLAEVLADLGQHPLLVGDARLGAGLRRQVLVDVAVDQVLDGRRLAALALVAGRVVAPVDLLAQFLRALARRVDRPARERADGVSAAGGRRSGS